ncbi:MAG TPA: hypothetical protein VF730_18225 [Terracidiphilus sp.]
MKALRPLRWLLLLILAATLIPATSRAEVVISVGFAPPPLLVYDQPPCPDPGLIWIPGYWAYGPDGYFWVPGAWVPAPFVGALWTPGYWGWDDGMYYWHPGYWGRHVGYYGGVNYGFGYFGIGFLGGRWNGGFFEYNTAVWHVDRDRIRRTYDDHDWDRHYVDRDSHVAFSGGPGGIRHDPDRRERDYMREQHYQRTNFQTQHIEAARQDRSAYYNVNHGRPDKVVASRPLNQENRPAERNGFDNGRQPNRPPSGADNNNQPNRGGYQGNREPQGGQQPQYRTQPEYRPVPQQRQPQPEARPQQQPQYRTQPEYRPAPQQRQPEPQARPQQQPQYRAQPEYRQVPQERQQQQRQEPQARQPERQPQERPQQESRPQQRPENHGNGGGHAEHEDHGHGK